MADKMTITTPKGATVEITKTGYICINGRKDLRFGLEITRCIKRNAALGDYIECGPHKVQLHAQDAAAIRAMFEGYRAELREAAEEYAKTPEGFSEQMHARMYSRYSDH